MALVEIDQHGDSVVQVIVIIKNGNDTDGVATVTTPISFGDNIHGRVQSTAKRAANAALTDWMQSRDTW